MGEVLRRGAPEAYNARLVGEPLDGLRPGSRVDFDRLYLAMHPRLVRTLTAVLGDPAAAEDCVQEAFVRAWRAWPRWRPEAPVEAWMYRIALNVSFSHRRRTPARPGCPPRRRRSPAPPYAG